MRLEGVIWKGEGAVHREDQTNLFLFSLMKRIESCVRRGRGREGEKGGGVVFDLF